MEDYDGSGFQVGDYVAGAGVTADVAVVVAADDVPHYGVVAFVEHSGLVGTDLGVRGAEEVGFYHVSGYVYVSYVVSGVLAPAFYVAVGVVAYGVAAAFYFFKEFGEHFNVFAYAEECCFGVVFVEHVQYPWSDLRPWAVIECEENSLFFVGKIPDESGEEFSDDFWRFDSHIWGVYVGKGNFLLLLLPT